MDETYYTYHVSRKIQIYKSYRVHYWLQYSSLHFTYENNSTMRQLISNHRQS